MTIGVLWEFFECLPWTMFFLLDMQKDTSHLLYLLRPSGPHRRQRPFAIHGITDLIVVANGEQIPLGLGGYLDIGLLDTMNDLLVNFIGAAVFSFLGYFYVKNRGKAASPGTSSPRSCPTAPTARRLRTPRCLRRETRRISPILLPGRNKPPRSRTY